MVCVSDYRLVHHPTFQKNSKLIQGIIGIES